MNILKMPHPLQGTPSEMGASQSDIWKGRAKIWICRVLNRLGIPGAIQDADIDDPLTGNHIKVRVGVLFTKVSVNGRDYYFRRLSGRFDGTGAGCS